MSTEAVAEELRQRVNSWMVAFNAKDREKLFALFHPDMIYANDSAPLMRGVDQITPWYEQAFEMVSGRTLFREEAIVVYGEAALVLGKFYFEPAEPAESPEGDGPVGETGRVAMIWRRGQDGQWLLAFDTDNRPPDSVPADFAKASENTYLTPEGVSR